MSKLVINESLKIPFAELLFTATRSRGPGGQNVNKVNSKIQLQWNVMSSSALTAYQRSKILTRAASRISKTGWLTISSQTSRHQLVNREECLQKLRVVILDAIHEKQHRIATRPTLSSRRRRRRAKEHQARKKESRRAPNIES